MNNLSEGTFKFYEERGFTYLVMNVTGSELFTVARYETHSRNEAMTHALSTCRGMVKVRSVIRSDADARAAGNAKVARKTRRVSV